jgi:hypothetical protein
MDSSAAQNVLVYFVLPVWLAAGFADYLCHRAGKIESTSGPKESLLHLLQFAEMALPTLAAIFLHINALVILVMIVCLVLHEATAIWDVNYAYRTRVVTPTEQHVHSFLEMLPRRAARRDHAALAAVSFPLRVGRRTCRLRRPSERAAAAVAVCNHHPAAGAVFEVLPYLEELVRSLREHRSRQSSDPRCVEPRAEHPQTAPVPPWPQLSHTPLQTRPDHHRPDIPKAE